MLNRITPLNSLDAFQENEIWIYGTGTFAKRVYIELLNQGIMVRGFLDHVQKTSFCELPVLQVSNLIIKKNLVVIIGICNLNVEIADIECILVELGIYKIVNPVQFAILLDEKDITFTNYWLSGDRSIYEENENLIQRFRDLLEDEDSKLEYDSILSYRILGKIENLRKPRGLDVQYIAQDLGSPPEKMRILELGSFKGEDIIRFQDYGYEIEYGILLEPDLRNYNKLVAVIQEKEIQNVIPLPLGAWKETTLLGFNSTGESGAQISVKADQMIPVIRVDDALSGQEFNYIKMDIEGAEIDALKGLEQYIGNHVPQLAISVYHKPNDIWEIGLLLESSFPGRYKYFLRTYGSQTFDCVLHAIPRVRKI